MTPSSCPRPAVAAPVLLLALALTACGGGGGGSDAPTSQPVAAAPPPVTTPAPPPSPAAPPPPAPAPAPEAGGGEVACAPGDAPQVRAAAFSMMSLVRSTAGLPPVTRLPALDGIAQAHARYAVANDSTGVDETPGRPCFTGADLATRLAGAGLVAQDAPGVRSRGEIVLAYTLPGSVEVEPWDLVYNALHNLYGRMFLLDPRAEQLGLGFSARPGGAQRAMVLDGALLGTPADGAAWAVWPRDGALSLPTRMLPSTAMKPLDARITEGYPVSVHAAAPLQISRFVLSQASNGEAVAVTLLTSGNDRHGFLSAGEAALVPQAPLAAGTTYRVELNATAGSLPLNLNWTFTTGN
jgi:hypothetical protein